MSNIMFVFKIKFTIIYKTINIKEYQHDFNEISETVALEEPKEEAEQDNPQEAAQ